ncbi:MAG TPA: sulfatase [Chloroflexota bacterium]|nr:sulfatase [Chloroflexota bacterium]
MTGGRPANLLFLFGDEHRGAALGCAGNPDVRTPHLDSLAAEGVRCARAYANTPVCTPSRGSLLTGQWPGRHGALSNDLPVRYGPATPSVARALGEAGAGYRCGYIGKWHLGGWPRDRFTPPGPARLGFDHLWASWECHHRYLRPVYHRDESPDPVVLDGRYEPEVQTDLALEWLEGLLEGEGGPPFCLFVSYGPPHDPYEPLPPGAEDWYDPAALTLRPNVAESAAERRDLAGYYAHITALDAQVGRLLRFLRQRGALENTLVVYSSDHGSMLGSHGHHHKQQPWEESVNVPLLLRFGEGGLPQGAESDLLIGVVDYAPTLLGLLGVPAPPAMQGRNLAPFLLAGEETNGGNGGQRPFSVYLSEAVVADQGLREGIRPWRGVRTARFTYARDLAGPWVLYDDVDDPYQQRNLAREPEAAELRATLERELQGWMDRLDDPLEPAEDHLARHGLTEAWAARQAHFHRR